MKSRTIKMQALALAIAIPMAAASAWSMSPAQTSAAAGGKADHSSVENTPLLQFSREGNRALREIQAARFNIFDGQPDVAVKLMNDAKVAIGNAEKDAPSFATTRSTIVDGKVVDSESSKRAATSVPVDGQLMLADDFVMTPEKRAHIDKANAQLKSGDHDKAIDELKLAAIDVNYTRVWMPMEQSEKHLDKAIKLAKSGKYYEANLALKAIQDNLTVDSVSLDELPKT